MKSLATKIVAGAFLALALAVLAIGGSSGDSSAADCNDGNNSKGRLAPGGSEMVEVTFCSDPTEVLLVELTWGKRIDESRDLALHITSPSGMTFHVDRDPSASEYWIGYAPLEEGDWTIEVINEGTKRVNYKLSVNFL